MVWGEEPRGMLPVSLISFPWGMVRALVSLLVFLAYFSDYIITYYNISSGKALEGNPIVAVLIHDPVGYWITAFATSFLTALLTYIAFGLKKTYGWIAAFIVIVVKASVVAWNMHFSFS